MEDYKHGLTSAENFRTCNSGIDFKDQEVSTCKQYKNALAYLVCINENGCSICQLTLYTVCIEETHKKRCLICHL